MYDVSSIYLTSRCWQTSSRHYVNIVLASAAYPLYPVNIDDIVDIAMLINIEQTLWAFFLVYIVDIAMLIDVKSTSLLHRTPNILFTSSTLSISQCWPTSNRHCCYIECLLSCLHRRLCHVDRHRVDILDVLIVDQYRVDIVSISYFFNHLRCKQKISAMETQYRFNIIYITMSNFDDVYVKEILTMSTM